jgi:dolichol-phosphate mannosyltransferase
LGKNDKLFLNFRPRHQISGAFFFMTPTPARRSSGSKRPAKPLVIVPTYNEIENIRQMYERIIKAHSGVDILIIDDGSPDGTGKLADRLAKRDKRVHVLHRAGKLGLGTAVIAGFQYALDIGYKLITTIDADLSHDPAYIPQMLSLMGQYDMVIGSRYVRDGGMVNWSIRRLIISMIANLMLKNILGIQQKDCSGGFKCYRAELIRKIGIDRVISPGYVFYVEILYRALKAGARVKEIPIIFVNRGKGKSKISLGEVVGYAKNIFKLKFLTMIGRI